MDVERKEIILAFLKSGFQLHPKAIEFLSQHEDKVNELIKKLSSVKPKPLIVTLEMVKDLLEEKTRKEKTRGKVKIIRKFEVQKEKRSVDDVLNYLLDRYEKMKKILITRLDLVNLISINKLTSRTQKFSIIGIVREKNQHTKQLVIEDPTGELTLTADEKFFEEIVLDDVLGFKCEREGNNFIVKDVVWPDVPLFHSINKTNDDVQALFISDIHFNKPNFKKDSYKKFLAWINSLDKLDYLFILGDIGSSNVFKDLEGDYTVIFCKGNTDNGLEVPSNVIQVPDPALLKIHDSIKILVTHGKFLEKYKLLFKTEEPVEILNSLLKRRHLDPVIDLVNLPKEDIFVLDTIPDIFVTGHFHKPGFKNYKGVTLISCGSFVSDPTYFLVNLKTREVVEKRF